MEAVKQALDFSGFDFIDFGCSDGKSIEDMQKLFPGAKGIGLDIDPRKVATAKTKGKAAEVADVTKLGAAQKVRFVSMSHFLEHLPGQQLAFSCIESACKIATGFVYIRQPWFDSDGYLFSKGLKLYWSDWRGHRYHMTAVELQSWLRRLLERKLINRFAIYGNGLVKDSSDSKVHPLNSPDEQNRWELGKHPEKPGATFDQDVFTELCAIAVTGEPLEEIERIAGFQKKIYDSGSVFAS